VIVGAHVKCGCALKKVAQHLDLHYSTISKIVKAGYTVATPIFGKEVHGMATWKCSCGFTKEGRCKPQKCEKCGEKGQFVKVE